jgi:superfamily II DNA or RNA helicase
MELYDWQKECLNAWVKNRYKGIVNAATGAGKTSLALAAAALLESAVGRIKVKVVVPKTFLVRQWRGAIISALGASRSDVGVYSGSHKSAGGCKYMIYVINSARYSFSKHMLEESGVPVLIIADECHHYGSDENAKIFDFAGSKSYSGVYYALGLSATPYSKNYREALVPFLGVEIYRFDFIQALEAGILSAFSLFNVSLEFDGGERAEYDGLSEKLSLAFNKLLAHYPRLYFNNSNGFFAQLDYIAKTHVTPEVRNLARAVSSLSLARKEIVHKARARIGCVVRLVELLGKDPKIIIFGERIEMADAICDGINAIMPGEAAAYHSGTHESIRKARLRDFEDSRLRILVSCRTLDEGLNVSDADVGIVVSSTNSERQRIQRLGRILRKKESGKRARFYYLYVKDTMESEEVLRDIHDRLRDTVNVVDLEYDEFTGSFNNERYRRLTETVLSRAADWSVEERAEFIRNVRLGSVSDEWLMTDGGYADISDLTKRARNYRAAMRMLSRLNGGGEI